MFILSAITWYFFDAFYSKTEIEFPLHINRLCAVNPGYMLNENYSAPLGSYYMRKWTKVYWSWPTSWLLPLHSPYPPFCKRFLLGNPSSLSKSNNLQVLVAPFAPFIPYDGYFPADMRLFPRSLTSFKTLKKVWWIVSNLSEECQFSERLFLGMGVNPNSFPRELRVYIYNERNFRKQNDIIHPTLMQLLELFLEFY